MLRTFPTVTLVAFFIGISTKAVRVTARRFLGALASSAEPFDSSSVTAGRFFAAGMLRGALFGRSLALGSSSSMSDVSGVGWTELLLLKSGETAVEGVPLVVAREAAGAFDFLVRGMGDGCNW